MQTDSRNTLSVDQLRKALRCLYDPAELRNSPLVQVFGLAQREDPASSLRQILVDAVEALRPAVGTPAPSVMWRVYHILFYRYIEQFTQKQVAADLAISVRQLRREENRALRLLASHLSSCCSFRSDIHMPSVDLSLPDSQVSGANEVHISREQELSRLHQSSPPEIADFRELIRGVLETAEPVMRALGVHIQCMISGELQRVAVQVISVRQALLNVLVTALRCVPMGQVQIEAENSGVNIRVTITPVRSHVGGPPLDIDGLESLEMARRLVELSGGALDVATSQNREQPFIARLLLPAAERVTVLVIDDNVDALQLYQRYLTGTRYRFIGTSDPDQVLAIAESSQPQLIILDVMLPRIDGWQLLGLLREHPKTRDAPVIICTILPQEQLALTLGAAAFIRKPVSRATLLAVLDQQVDQLLRESC